jgi:ArsR family transcriptional regulator, arsenate/arsenite/antimonite-responsive transcriptional repressor / arsenate reductase (thioredoxin)
MDRDSRAHRHAALSDEKRLLIVDQLVTGDRTVAELADLSDMRGNLLAHHLDVLDDAGLIERRISEGDRRRRYVSLRWEHLPPPFVPTGTSDEEVTFVCTHNSARSQFAAALWEQMTGSAASSAGSLPAAGVHPKAVKVASEFDIDISRATPSPYSSLPGDIGLIISVCDRANEGDLPRAARHLHWSIPDPVPTGTLAAFRSAFADIAERMEHLAGVA